MRERNFIVKQALFLAVFFVLQLLLSGKLKGQNFDYCKESKIEYSKPIVYDTSNVVVFWNGQSTMFKFAPSFKTENKSWLLNEPIRYFFDAFSYANNNHYTFYSDNATVSLQPIWDALPEGLVYLKIEAQTTVSNRRVLVAERNFTKAAAFCPPYPPAKYGYSEAFARGLSFMYNQAHVQAWLSESQPNHRLHPIYCYSALEVGSVINAMVLYHRHFPENESSIIIARKAADYLISQSEAGEAPLAGFPQVYEGDQLAAARFHDEIILTEPAATAQSYLLLFDETGDSTYLGAALRIADAYKKTQLENGTWPIRLSKTTGLPTTQVLCIPMKIINFLQLLVENYHFAEYQQMIDPAISWTFENPVKTFDWTGQFEDVEAVKPYQNLTKYEASWFAQYLLKHYESTTKQFELAKQLINFCEDQFVVWEQPAIYDNWGNSSQNWHVPAVLEQYNCYVPIDASAVQMIDTYYLAWQKTGNYLYLEKAKTLANSLVNTQEEDGRIPTFWAGGFDEFWNNCMVSSLMMLEKMKETE